MACGVSVFSTQNTFATLAAVAKPLAAFASNASESTVADLAGALARAMAEPETIALDRVSLSHRFVRRFPE